MYSVLSVIALFTTSHALGVPFVPLPSLQVHILPFAVNVNAIASSYIHRHCTVDGCGEQYGADPVGCIVETADV